MDNFKQKIGPPTFCSAAHSNYVSSSRYSLRSALECAVFGTARASTATAAENDLERAELLQTS